MASKSTVFEDGIVSVSALKDGYRVRIAGSGQHPQEVSDSLTAACLAIRRRFVSIRLDAARSDIARSVDAINVPKGNGISYEEFRRQHGHAPDEPQPGAAQTAAGRA